MPTYEFRCKDCDYTMKAESPVTRCGHYFCPVCLKDGFSRPLYKMTAANINSIDFRDKIIQTADYKDKE